jgi:hypothetical protein
MVGREDEVHFMLSTGWWTSAGLVLSLIGVLLLFRYGMPYRVRTRGQPIRLRSVTIHERQLLIVDMKCWGGWDCF